MADAPMYEPETRYTTRVSRPVNDGPFRYLPRHEIETDGATLNRWIEKEGEDVIASAEPV
ncbi:hypothetical protein P7F60_29000 [Rhizobium sp. YJ-22]|uniref:hypothetical protein n=1 Tax=Rhizobium sp. YJ-22 TaxID=3037556 RepID=UPI0024124030|nr:hypothetical protein [Rhizobium sp. YJ-22]MDG3580422.1 hypothetical protein [Rhizobium sp. YJ-22]